jgi:hypothetical protein
MYCCIGLYKFVICYDMTFSPSYDMACNGTLIVHLIYSIILEWGHELFSLNFCPGIDPVYRLIS